MPEIEESEPRRVRSRPPADPVVETESTAERLRKLSFVGRAIASLDAAPDREGSER